MDLPNELIVNIIKNLDNISKFCLAYTSHFFLKILTFPQTKGSLSISTSNMISLSRRCVGLYCPGIRFLAQSRGWKTPEGIVDVILPMQTVAWACYAIRWRFVSTRESELALRLERMGWFLLWSKR
jgi:hypothetical protein